MDPDTSLKIVKGKRPYARTLIYQNKSYKKARKSFRYVAWALWVGAALALFYKNQLNEHEQIPSEDTQSTHSRVRRSATKHKRGGPDQMKPEDQQNWPYDPLYVDACKEKLPRDAYTDTNQLQVKEWKDFFDKHRDIYKERHHFDKYVDKDTGELDVYGKTLCCLEEQDKHFHHQGAKSEFPKVGLFTDNELRAGAFFIHLTVSLYMFAALAIVCDDYFVPALERVVEELQLSEDVAGATFMAAGSSAPELFTSMIGVFVAKSDIGIGTIVGSAVFNILVIIGACGLFVPGDIKLSVWPLFRDSTFYLITILSLLVVIFPEFNLDACPEWRNKGLYDCNDKSKFNAGTDSEWYQNCECRTSKMFVDTLNQGGTGAYWTCESWKTIGAANCSKAREQIEKNSDGVAKTQSIDGGKPVPLYKHFYADDFLVQKDNTIRGKEIGRCECIKHIKDKCTNAKQEECKCQPKGTCTNTNFKFRDCHDWSPTTNYLADKYNCSDPAGRRRERNTFMQNCECQSYKGVARFQLLSGDIALCGKSEVYLFEAFAMLVMYMFYIVIMKFNEQLESIFSAKTGVKKRSADDDALENEKVLLNDTPQKITATPLLEQNCNNNNNLYATCDSSVLDPDDQAHVEELVARSHDHRPGIDFDDAGMRVMMTSNFAPKTRLKAAAKMVSKNQDGLVLAKETQEDGTVKTILIQRKSHHEHKLHDEDEYAQGPVSNYNSNNNNNYNNNNNSDTSSEGPASDDGDDEGPTDPFELPKDGFCDTMKFLIAWPINLTLFYTVPQCGLEEYQKYYIVSFVMSTVWIAFYSYIMVWMVAYCGFALGIPDTIMGLTFLAAGTSVPDTIASVLVAKQGMGDMAVSNSIGSNVFDILLGLALPWSAQMMIAHIVPPPKCENLAQFTNTVVINSKGLVISVTLLLLSLVFVVGTIHFNGWKLNTKAGILITAAYLLFIFGSIYTESAAAVENGTCEKGLRLLQDGF